MAQNPGRLTFRRRWVAVIGLIAVPSLALPLTLMVVVGDVDLTDPGSFSCVVLFFLGSSILFFMPVVPRVIVYDDKLRVVNYFRCRDLRYEEMAAARVEGRDVYFLTRDGGVVRPAAFDPPRGAGKDRGRNLRPEPGAMTMAEAVNRRLSRQVPAEAVIRVRSRFRLYWPAVVPPLLLCFLTLSLLSLAASGALD